MTSSGSLRFTFSHWGRGVPTLFLHGFTGDRNSFAHLELCLGGNVKAWCCDLPGHLSMPLPNSTGEQGFLETVDALAEQLPGPMPVVGYSQGARLALTLALRHPHLVTSLCLESGTPGIAQKKQRQARQLQDEVLARSLETLGIERFIERWESLPLFDGLKVVPSAAQVALRRRRLGHQAEQLAQSLRVLGGGTQPSWWSVLHTVRCPTLLLVGQRDVKFMKIAEKMAQQMPQCWVRSFANVGHVPHLECPAQYADELRLFLNAPIDAEGPT